ncbi:GGDEF domain-containing protein [Oceanicoccus sagamiensis]|uniref:diguanylate cyclase n=1 Tax=Oceanicoccus sagamiensis TaxID=716816 RepID=A0A1X9NCR9_9GAMM|nr:GGDEF domain-containing protein [Oceanicoccus sagamiensis]ARN73329.1 hypothetical protein BST96_03930 [Oceanicoccus sagamiensis]
MPLTLKPLLRLTLPLLVLALSFYALGKTPLINSNYLELLGLLPYMIFAVVLGLAHYFNRSRFFSAALLLTTAYWLIQSHLQTSLTELYPLYFYTALSLLLPLGLLFLAVLPERGLWNMHGILPLSITPLLVLMTYTASLQYSQQQLSDFTGFFAIKPYSGYVLSIYASLGFLVSLLLALVMLLIRNNEAEASFCACIILAYVTLAGFDQPLISSILFSACGLTLAIGLLRNSFEMAYRDDLTGLLGRRAFNEKIRGLGKQYSIAMMDVDHFKKFNDTHGHDVGDDVLKIVANHIAQVTGGGIPYRYGGEEFCVIFPGKKMKPCVPHLEAVREAIADYSISLRDKTTRPKNSKEGVTQRGKPTKKNTVSVTISIGVAEKTEHQTNPEQVLKAADKALYRAKQNGRNCLAR